MPDKLVRAAASSAGGACPRKRTKRRASLRQCFGGQFDTKRGSYALQQFHACQAVEPQVALE
jgi:hypothetical protein